MNLVPLDPREAHERYLDDRRGDVREKTLEAHTYRVSTFLDWLEGEDVEDLTDLNGRHLHDYKVYRRDVDEVATTTLQSQLSTIRQFLRFCRDIDAVPHELPEKVRPPTPENDSRDTRVRRDHAESVLDHLDTFRYASRDHALFAVAWHTGCRMGGLRALDVDDVVLDDPDLPHLQFRHRRGRGTPLKNGSDGERDVALAGWVADLLDDYLDECRNDIEDDHGRRPLFTTAQGRLSEGWLRTTMYQLTKPCLAGECPHDRDPSECDAATGIEYVSKCPSVRPPHDVRRGSISDHLRRGWPIEQLAERINATPRVIRKHYDVRSTRESMLTRRDVLGGEADD